jgi:Fe2+ transport system protein FeoA
MAARAGTLRLSEGREKGNYIVERMEADEELKSRLRGLGLDIGTEVQILRQKRGKAVIVWVRGTRLALGGRLAGKIWLKEVER